MAQQTFNDGDDFGSIRSKINANANDATGRFGQLENFSTFSNIADIIGTVNGSG